MRNQNALFLLAAITAGVSLAQPGGGPPGGGGVGGGTQGDGIWRRSAGYGELFTLDHCFGHQPGTGQYHYHASPQCLRLQLDDNIQVDRNSRTGPAYGEKAAPWTHSPILGWASDGNPLYGPYGYSDPTSSGSALKRLKSGFRMRSITTRTTLPSWALGQHSGVSQTLTATQYGPDVSAKFPLGRYVEDFEWVAGVGDLDQYNGRFTVTPEFPNGTYAYYATIDDSGNAAFPFLLAGEFYGVVSGGFNSAVSSSAADYFNSGTVTAGPTAPSITSWSTKNWNKPATIVSGFDPSAGSITTWPGSNVISGAKTSGSTTTPTNAETQRIRFTSDSVYVTSNGVPLSAGPWFQNDQVGGVFTNFPTATSTLFTIPRSPAVTTTHTATGMGAQGQFVNGTSLFNFLDGVSYSNSTGDDPVTAGAVIGGPVSVTTLAAIASAASFEQGPIPPGSLVTATPLFYSVLATSTASAPSAAWPTALGGASVSVKDSAGSSSIAQIFYASPTQLNFRMPAGLSSGAGTVTISAGTQTITSQINIQPVYPNLFMTNRFALAAATVTRVRNGVTSQENVYTTTGGNVVATPIALGTDQVYLTLYGSELGSATSTTATIGGVEATVLYAGPQGTYDGLDQFNLQIPASLAGRGKVDVVVTASGKPSNPVNFTVQ
jgi:uncharacterized protein (TIGR03437 family)